MSDTNANNNTPEINPLDVPMSFPISATEVISMIDKQPVLISTDTESIVVPWYQPVEFTLMDTVEGEFEPKAPLHGSDTAAGFDLYAAAATVVFPGSSILVSTGVCMKIPNGWCGQINPRSSVASKTKLRIGARVIDSDYRGEVMVNIHNDSDSEITTVVRGERIAQIVFIPHLNQMVQVETLDETERGDGGFGSTGV